MRLTLLASAAFATVAAIAGLTFASPQATTWKLASTLSPSKEVPKPSGTRAGAAGAFAGTAVVNASGGAKIAWRLTFSKLTGPVKLVVFSQELAAADLCRQNEQLVREVAELTDGKATVEVLNLAIDIVREIGALGELRVDAQILRQGKRLAVCEAVIRKVGEEAPLAVVTTALSRPGGIIVPQS